MIIKENPQFAYFLGWMYSDGCITKDRRCNSKTVKIHINKKDSEVLNCFDEIIDWSKGFDSEKYITLRKNNLEFAEILENKYGVLQRKSYENKDNLHFPKLSKELYQYFLRGLFDGDGSYSIVNNNPSIIHIGFITVSKTFIYELQAFLQKINIESKIKIEIPNKIRKQTAYILRIRKKSEVKKFIEFVFADKLEYSLQRKRDRALFFLKEYKTNSEIAKIRYANSKIKFNSFLTKDIREKARNTRNIKLKTGEIKPSMLGRRHSKETKLKMRKSHLKNLPK